MFDLKSVSKPAVVNPGGGGNLNNEIIAFLDDDVQTFPERAEDSVTVTENIVMKPGKYMHTLYSTPYKVKPIQTKVENNDNPDIQAYEVGLEFWHPGLEKAILAFQAKHSTSKIHLIIRDCVGSKKYWLGQPCNPLYLGTAELQWEPKPSGGRGTQLAFSGEQTLPFAVYEGELTLAEEASGSPAASGSPSESGA
jgi:hypothetical protein